MKILKKTGIVLSSFMLSLGTKVKATYGFEPTAACDYGIELRDMPRGGSIAKISIFERIANSAIIPIILLLGIIIYCIKSTSTVLKKVIISGSIILAYILFRVIINLIF